MDDDRKLGKPAVYMFQTLEPELVEGTEKLKEWEKALVERVKLHPRAAAAMRESCDVGTETGTLTRTVPPNATWDDCDLEEVIMA